MKTFLRDRVLISLRPRVNGLWRLGLLDAGESEREPWGLGRTGFWYIKPSNQRKTVPHPHLTTTAPCERSGLYPGVYGLTCDIDCERVCKSGYLHHHPVVTGSSWSHLLLIWGLIAWDLLVVGPGNAGCCGELHPAANPCFLFCFHVL